MKKLTRLPARQVLPIMLLLTVAFFSPQKANAQTDAECFTEYQKKEYKCLQKFNKCIYSCNDINTFKSCENACSAQDKTCSDQASADLTACKAAIPKDKEAVPSKTESGQDCRKIFDRELYKCLTDANVCRDACQQETKKPDGTAYFNSGEIYDKCTKKHDCNGKDKACGDQAQANFWACGKSNQKPQEAKKETSKQTPPVLIGEWFSRFSKAIDGLIALPGAFADVVYEDKFYLAGDFPKLSEMSLEDFYQGNWYPNDDTPDRSPNITVKDEQKAWDFGRLDTPLTKKVNITVLQGEAQIKSPDSPQFIPITPKGGDTVQVSYLDSTMKTVSDDVQLRYTWSADSGAVINVPKWSEIKFKEPAEVGGLTSHSVELRQGEVEVKVRNNNPSQNQFGVDAGWLGVTASRTHFWVSQSEDKKVAVIGVYEGEVEVKTKDGKTEKVSPDGDKPGVVVVAQKLSITKLVIAGTLLLAALGGIVWFAKGKMSAKSSKIKSRK